MRPKQLLILLILLWGIIGGVILFYRLPIKLWYVAGISLAIISCLDLILLYLQKSPSVKRILPEVLPLGVERDVMLEFTSKKTIQADIYDLYPSTWKVGNLPYSLKLPAKKVTQYTYQITPTERGDFNFLGVHFKYSSPFKLWSRLIILDAPQKVRIYPNFAPLTRLALLSAEQASRLVGAHIKRRRGEGTDFHQMREYRVGDSLRQIDWKATSRSRKLISREYQDEKNQQLVILLDSGRRMMAKEGDVSHFDNVLNAAMVVSYLALRQGDAAGLLTAGEETRWVAPVRGISNVDALLRATYDLQPKPLATDYLQAATELVLRQPRRALIMLITNARDEDIEDLLGAVKILQKRHLVCVASLRENDLNQVLNQPVLRFDDAIQTASTAYYLQQREEAHNKLRSNRVMVLDVTSEELPSALVERYLAIKRDGLL